MAAVFGQLSEMRAPSPPGRTHPCFKKNPRLLAPSHAARRTRLKKKHIGFPAQTHLVHAKRKIHAY